MGQFLILSIPMLIPNSPRADCNALNVFQERGNGKIGNCFVGFSKPFVEIKNCLLLYLILFSGNKKISNLV